MHSGGKLSRNSVQRLSAIREAFARCLGRAFERQAFGSRKHSKTFHHDGLVRDF